MSEDKQLIKSDIRKYGSLESVSKTEGGQVLIKSIKSDILASLGLITAQWDTLPENTLRATCGVLNDRINLFKTLLNAPKNKKGAMIAMEELLKIEPDIE